MDNLLADSRSPARDRAFVRNLVEMFASSSPGQEIKPGGRCPQYPGDDAVSRIWELLLSELGRRSREPVVIYGAGGQTRKLFAFADPRHYKVRVAAIADPVIRGPRYAGYPLIPPQRIAKVLKHGTIIITSYAYETRHLQYLLHRFGSSPRIVIRSLYQGPLYRRVCPPTPPVTSPPPLPADPGEFSGPQTAVFYADQNFFSLARTSLALRKQGWRTLLVGTSQSSVDALEGYFDRTCHLPGLEETRRLFSELRPAVFHFLGWVLSYSRIAWLRQWCRGSPVVCEAMDIPHFVSTRPDHYARFLRRDPASMRREREAFRWIWHHFDGVLFPYSDRTLPIFARQGWRTSPDRHRPFAAWPLPELFAPPRETLPTAPYRLTFVGGVPPDACDDRAYGDAKLNRILPELAAQPLAVTVWNNPLITPPEVPWQESYPRLAKLSRQHPNFTFRPGYPPERLRVLMPEQDFGLMLYDFAGVRIGRQHLSEVVPSKFFHYLELGLPILVSPELKAVAALVRRHNLGLVVPRSRVSRLAALLQAEIRRYPAWLRNIDDFRTRFSMYRQVPALEAWYRALAKDSYPFPNPK